MVSSVLLFTFVRFALVAVALLPQLALALPRHAELSMRRVRPRGIAPKDWQLVDKYQGQGFLDGWDFFDQDDPTHGLVNYQNADDARAKGLAKVDGDVVVLAVDDSTPLPPGQRRDSVRISTKKAYEGGLFIADIQKMPVGCSIWPAYWSVGPDWPSGGEIDVLEGVHNQDTNQYTLHTTEGCTLSPIGGVSGAQLGTQCASSPQDNSGCAYKDTDGRSYGGGFNSVGGGVYAHLWDQSGISIWHFARGEIPQDIQDGRPDPSGWPAPAASFSSQSCPMEHFHGHKLTFDTTLCGDWAGATYANAGCPGTCEEAVANPENFREAKWNINYVAVYA